MYLWGVLIVLAVSVTVAFALEVRANGRRQQWLSGRPEDDATSPATSGRHNVELGATNEAATG